MQVLFTILGLSYETLEKSEEFFIELHEELLKVLIWRGTTCVPLLITIPGHVIDPGEDSTASGWGINNHDNNQVLSCEPLCLYASCLLPPASFNSNSLLLAAIDKCTYWRQSESNKTPLRRSQGSQRAVESSAAGLGVAWINKEINCYGAAPAGCWH